MAEPGRSGVSGLRVQPAAGRCARRRRANLDANRRSRRGGAAKIRTSGSPLHADRISVTAVMTGARGRKSSRRPPGPATRKHKGLMMFAGTRSPTVMRISSRHQATVRGSTRSLHRLVARQIERAGVKIHGIAYSWRGGHASTPQPASSIRIVTDFIRWRG